MTVELVSKHRAIIGEAALRLAVHDREINMSSLIDELNYMGRIENSDERIKSVRDASCWLSKLVDTGSDHKKIPFLDAITNLNEDK